MTDEYQPAYYNTANARPVPWRGPITVSQLTTLVIGMVTAFWIAPVIVQAITSGTIAPALVNVPLTVLTVLLVFPDPRRWTGFREAVARSTGGRIAPEPHDGPTIDNVIVAARYALRRRSRRPQPDNPLGGQKTDGTRISRTPPANVGPVRWLRTSWRGLELCILDQREAGATLGFEIEAAGDGIPDPEDDDSLRARVADAQRVIADSDLHTDRIEQLTIVSPVDGEGNNVHDLQPADADRWLVHSYQAAEDAIAKGEETYRHYIGMRVPTTHLRAKAVEKIAKQYQGDRDKALCHIIRAELDTVVDALVDAGVTVLGPLNTAATAMMIRHTQNPDWPLLPWNTDAPASPDDAWSVQAPTETADAFICEGWHTAVAEVVLPTGYVRADFLRPMTRNANNVHRSMSTVMNLTPHGVAMTKTERAADLSEGDIAYDADRGRRLTWSKKINQEAIQQHGRDVAHGYTTATIAVYVGVSARCDESCTNRAHATPTALTRAKESIATKAAQSGCTTKWLWLQHAAALPNVMLLGRGLK